MATPPVQVEFTVVGLEEVKRSFTELSATSKETKQSVEQDSKAMAQGFRLLYYQIFITAQTGRLIAELGKEMGFLDEATASAISKTMNLISMFGGLMSTISSLIPLIKAATAAKWMHTVATWAQTHATAAFLTVATLGIGAAAMAAGLIAVSAAVSAAQSRGTSTILKAGAYEHVPHQQPLTLVFDIHDNRFASDYDADRTGDRIVDRLRRAGVI